MSEDIASKSNGAAKKLSAREKLKAFYKLDQIVRPSFDLDSDSFEYRPYLNKQYQEKGIKDLIQLDTQLVCDIKQLHSDSKNLIYENYSKFIKASESIGSIKEDLNAMESELNTVSDLIKDLKVESQKIDDGLYESRKELSELNKVNNMLRRLRFLFELPYTLKSYIQTGNYNAAIKHFYYTANLVKRYHHMKVFMDIEIECNKAMEEVECKLQEGIMDDYSNMETICKNVGLLLYLKKGGDFSQLLDTLIQRCRPKLIGVLKNRPQVGMKEGGSLYEWESESLVKLNSEFLPLLNDFVGCVDRTFFNSNIPEVNRLNDVNEEEKQELMKKFEEEVYSIFENNYIKINNPYLKLSSESEIDVKLLHHYTSIYRCYLNDIAQYENLNGTNSSINLLQNLRLIICDFEKKVIDRMVNDTISKFTEKLHETFLNKDVNIRAFYNDTMKIQADLISIKNWLLDRLLTSDLDLLQHFLSDDIGFWQLSGTWSFIFRYIQTKLNDMFHSIITNTHLIALKDIWKDNGIVLLIWSRFLYDLYANVLKMIYDNYIKSLIKQNNIPFQHKPSQTEVIEEWYIDLNNLIDQSLDISKQVLVDYVDDLTLPLILDLVDYYSMSDFMNYPEIQKVSERWKILTKELVALEFIIASVYSSKNESDYVREDTSKESLRSPIRSSINNSSPLPPLPTNSKSSITINRSNLNTPLSMILPTKSTSQHNLWLNKIDKLFLDKVEVYDIIPFNMESILVAISKRLLKGLIESIRLNTFNSNSLHQLQLDLEYWNRNAPSSITNEPILQSLVEEALANAMKRTLKGAVLDLMKLDSILGPTVPL